MESKLLAQRDHLAENIPIGDGDMVALVMGDYRFLRAKQIARFGEPRQKPRSGKSSNPLVFHGMFGAPRRLLS
jgi:hypothetical protein